MAAVRQGGWLGVHITNRKNVPDPALSEQRQSSAPHAVGTRGSLTVIAREVTEEVAPNESQRDPKALMSEALIYEPYTRQANTHLPTAVTDALGRRTDFTYDENGNVLTVTRLAGTADAVTTTFTYHASFSQVASVTDPLSHTTAFGYDGTGNLTSITDREPRDHGDLQCRRPAAHGHDPGRHHDAELRLRRPRRRG